MHLYVGLADLHHQALLSVQHGRKVTPGFSAHLTLPLSPVLCLQTYIGSILASVNPYQPIAGLYEGAAVERYRRCHLGELPPHIFAVANECYRCLWKRQDNQCVLIR